MDARARTCGDQSSDLLMLLRMKPGLLPISTATSAFVLPAEVGTIDKETADYYDIPERAIVIG